MNGREADLRRRLAETQAMLDYAASTGDECALEVEALRSRLAEAEKQLAEAHFILGECLPILIGSCQKHDPGALISWDMARGSRWPK